MTDPVDTDALRETSNWVRAELPNLATDIDAAADEVDRLRAYEAYNEHSAEWWEQQVGNLQAVIENAPHDVGCATPAESLLGAPRDPQRPCTCWKAETL